MSTAAWPRDRFATRTQGSLSCTTGDTDGAGLHRPRCRCRVHPVPEHLRLKDEFRTGGGTEVMVDGDDLFVIGEGDILANATL